MQNKTWILVAVVVIILAAIGFFFFKGGLGGLSTFNNTSLRTLLASNSSQKCSFSNGESSGTIYVGAGKMRGDFTSKAAEGSAQSHMIISNDIAYVWIDGTSQGYRMPFEDLSGQSTQNGGIDADAKVATDCTSWQASETSFTLPTDVTFSALPNAAGAAPTSSGDSQTSTGAGADVSAGTTADYHTQQCAACDMVADASGKAQCKASFDCE